MAEDKKKQAPQPQGWIPVEPPAPKAVPAPKAASRPAAPAPGQKETPAPPIPAHPRPAAPVKPEERRLWEDPVLSPWAKGPTQSTPPPAPTTSVVGEQKGHTTCPRCGTPIEYSRYGSPPWVAQCTKCGAQGRISK